MQDNIILPGTLVSYVGQLNNGNSDQNSVVVVGVDSEHTHGMPLYVIVHCTLPYNAVPGLQRKFSDFEVTPRQLNGEGKGGTWVHSTECTLIINIII